MEEIIGLIALIAAFIFKVIGSRLDKASGKPAPSAEPQEVFPELTLPDGEPDWISTILNGEPDQDTVADLEPEAVWEQFAAPKTAEEALRQIRPARQMLQEEDKKSREKIDPKKLIVYSEIMNRKY